MSKLNTYNTRFAKRKTGFMIVRYGKTNPAHKCKNVTLNVREGACVSSTTHLVCLSQVSGTLFSCIMVLRNQYYNFKILEVWRGVEKQASLLFTLQLPPAWGKPLLRHIPKFYFFYLWTSSSTTGLIKPYGCDCILTLTNHHGILINS